MGEQQIKEINEEIAENLMNGLYNNDPHGATEAAMKLSGYYSWICGQLEIILSQKPKVWNEMRKDVKSDTACERKWEMTPDGINEMALKLRAKSVEKMMSSLRTLVRLQTNQVLSQ